MMIILSEVRYLLDSILPPGSTEVSHLPTQASPTMLTVSEEATGDGTGGSEGSEGDFNKYKPASSSCG